MESSTSSKPSLNDHWLYRIIPRHQENLTLKRPWEYITWTLFGNDNDGIFGEGPKSGTKWIQRWNGKIEKYEVKEYKGTIEKTRKVVKDDTFDPGDISFKRFVMWQLRNPLHNFTFYVIDFAAKKNLALFKLALISTKEISFFQRLKKTTPFPMGINSGIYFGLHMLPFVSFRLNLFKWRWLEGYTGWRPNGAFGFFALRLKKLEE
jgi:hypothetical protein